MQHDGNAGTLRIRMRRLLIILLLLVVPLQTALASVCGYCAHTARADTDPHALVHGAAKLQQPGADLPDTSLADAGDDAECPLCHLGCGSFAAASAPGASIDLPTTAPPHLCASYDPSHLDRIARVPLSVACSS